MYWSSSTKWETSLFGGFNKILSDFPRIKTSFNFDYDFKEKTDLPYYLKVKLADITQLKIKQFKLEDYLTANAKVEKQINFQGEEERFIVPNKKDIKRVVDFIGNHDPELGNLFKHFKDEILNTEFYYKLNDEQEKYFDEKEGADKLIDRGDKELVKKIISKIVSETEKFEYKPKIWGDSFSSDFQELKSNTTFYNVSTQHPDIKKVKYTSDEEIASQKLLNLLDISFDPKSDKVDNLRNGKLDIAKIATVHSGNTRVYYKVEENISTKPFAVCILMDESGSMGSYYSNSKSKNPATQQHNLVKILYRTFSQILPKDKIYIYGHSGDQETNENPEIRIYHDPYNQKFEECFEAQELINFNENYDGIVIEKIYDEIRSKTSENILFISISDGEPSGCDYGGRTAIDEMKRVIEKCRRDGFVTVGVGFQYGGVKDIYSYSTTVTELQESPKLVSALLNKVVKLEFQNDEC